jgi:hypothetical protein
MRRYVPVFVAGAALLAAACSDSIAPKRSTEPSNMIAAATPLGHAVLSSVSDYGTYTFTLSPNGGREKIGNWKLDYPANAVCDPHTSGYGPTEWTNPCVTVTQPVTITATYWTDSYGRTFADFSPDIRFDPSKNVTMTAGIHDLRGLPLSDAIASQFKVYYEYVSDGFRYSVDESPAYPELETQFEVNKNSGNLSGKVIRKIYHFSGYYVRSGRVCDSDSGDCVDTDVALDASASVQY